MPAAGLVQVLRLPLASREGARAVLADFSVTLPAETEIRVWDSTAETRFLVMPKRPAETDGCSEAKLATLITRAA